MEKEENRKEKEKSKKKGKGEGVDFHFSHTRLEPGRRLVKAGSEVVKQQI